MEIPNKFKDNSEKTLKLLNDIANSIMINTNIISHYKEKEKGSKEKSDFFTASAVEFTCDNSLNVYYYIIRNKDFMGRINVTRYNKNTGTIYISIKK